MRTFCASHQAGAGSLYFHPVAADNELTGPKSDWRGLAQTGAKRDRSYKKGEQGSGGKGSYIWMSRMKEGQVG